MPSSSSCRVYWPDFDAEALRRRDRRVRQARPPLRRPRGAERRVRADGAGRRPGATSVEPGPVAPDRLGGGARGDRASARPGLGGLVAGVVARRWSPRSSMLEWAQLTEGSATPAAALHGRHRRASLVIASASPADRHRPRRRRDRAAAGAAIGRDLWRPVGVALRRRSSGSACSRCGCRPTSASTAILFVFAVVWATDTGAFFAGRAHRRPEALAGGLAQEDLGRRDRRPRRRRSSPGWSSRRLAGIALGLALAGRRLARPVGRLPAAAISSNRP